MDKKLTFTGGEPDLNIDDILRDPIANRAALFGLMLGLGVTTDCLISGAAVTVNAGVNAQVTAGYVWLNGEILQVDAATVSETLGSDLWEFQKQTTYDSNGDKTFNDGTPRQTWEKNRAILVNVAAITGFDAANAPSLLATVVNNQKATQGEVEAGVVDNKIVTPAKLIALQATEAQKGLAEVATEAETKAVTDDTKIITPSKLPAFANSFVGLKLVKWLQITAAVITDSKGPGTVTVNNPSTGVFEYTHNIGSAEYMAVITTGTGSGAISHQLSKASNVLTANFFRGTTLTDPTLVHDLYLFKISYQV